ncbi:MAG: hypothetical protein ACFBSF_00565 [Leptolyngbyaceae cyanobacterium]
MTLPAMTLQMGLLVPKFSGLTRSRCLCPAETPYRKHLRQLYLVLAKLLRSWDLTKLATRLKKPFPGLRAGVKLAIALCVDTVNRTAIWVIFRQYLNLTIKGQLRLEKAGCTDRFRW